MQYAKIYIFRVNCYRTVTSMKKYMITNFPNLTSLRSALQILHNPVDVLNSFWSKWHEREISPSTTAHKHLKWEL